MGGGFHATDYRATGSLCLEAFHFVPIDMFHAPRHSHAGEEVSYSSR